MGPIDFPERTRLVGLEQPEYETLPAYVDGQETVSCWRLTIRERLRFLFSGRLWLRQLNHGEPLQPQCLQLDKPSEVFEE